MKDEPSINVKRRLKNKNKNHQSIFQFDFCSHMDPSGFLTVSINILGGFVQVPLG